MKHIVWVIQVEGDCSKYMVVINNIIDSRLGCVLTQKKGPNHDTNGHYIVSQQNHDALIIHYHVGQRKASHLYIWKAGTIKY